MIEARTHGGRHITHAGVAQNASSLSLRWTAYASCFLTGAGNVGARTLTDPFMLYAQASSLDVTMPPGRRARFVSSAVENALRRALRY